MTDPQPQPVLAPLSDSALFLTLVIEDGGEDSVRDVLAELSALTRSVGFRSPDEALSCVLGVGSEAWDRLFDGPRPAQLHPLPEFAGTVHAAVSTPGDLHLHLRARRQHPCFELAKLVMSRLGGAARVVDEVPGFRYFDRRDLLGFVDGTENPTGTGAAEAALINDPDDPFHGGSYVIVQKYLHDMDAWQALTVEQQQLVIGRTKLEDVEMDDAPANSHIVVNQLVEPDGTELEILRENMPFGSIGAGEFGTYFIGYAASPAVTERMLHRMFIGEPEGNYDRILDVSTAHTGALFFVPSQDFLDDLPSKPGEVGAAVELVPPARTDLGIGGLR
ncbi:MAG TPA: Dyp-type peroxidase [Pseudonocardia sp.]|jgi:putative iron-dependent peroxidase